MGKFHQFLTELSAHHTIVAPQDCGGVLSFYFFINIEKLKMCLLY